MAETSPTHQIVFNDGHHQLKDINEQLIREAAEQFVLDLIAGNNFH
jgi:Holliday junction resolvasome RuvABC ATP-dependent DNA helicase subunit